MYSLPDEPVYIDCELLIDSVDAISEVSMVRLFIDSLVDVQVLFKCLRIHFVYNEPDIHTWLRKY